jgi:hypothetical protein
MEDDSNGTRRVIAPCNEGGGRWGTRLVCALNRRENRRVRRAQRELVRSWKISVRISFQGTFAATQIVMRLRIKTMSIFLLMISFCNPRCNGTDTVRPGASGAQGHEYSRAQGSRSRRPGDFPLPSLAPRFVQLRLFPFCLLVRPPNRATCKSE